jgi:hypothetical protein
LHHSKLFTIIYGTGNKYDKGLSSFQCLNFSPRVEADIIRMSGLTVYVSGVWTGVDSTWEQRKLESRKMLENAAESPVSSTRFVVWTRFNLQGS